MPDLRLVGVHDDGQHLLLVDDGGERYLLAVDEALRAAVRPDRASLSSLQPASPSGLRPRDVQARIRAGATSEEVAVLAGWSVDKVRRYEGPILAERAHVAELARRVRLRRRGEPVLLGAEVSARLEHRGVAAESVIWDSWRTEEGPWTVVVYFVAGGRERQARWHLDLASSAVTPVDDEARWLSEESAPAEGPASGLRLAAVSSPGVYDIEADGGVTSTGARDAGSLDLVTAMRSRRREVGRGVPARPARTPLPPSTDDPTAVPGYPHPAHQGNRRRAPQPEPLELDPTLMDDPPAAHPPASAYQDLASADAAEARFEDLVDVPLPLGGDLEVESLDAGPAVEQAEVFPDASLADEAAVLHDGAPDEVGDDVDDVVLVEHVTVVETAAVVDVPTEDGEAGAEITPENAASDPATSGEGTSEQAARPAQRAPQRNAKSRSGGRSRSRRSSVPSWDDIMFGAKRD